MGDMSTFEMTNEFEKLDQFDSPHRNDHDTSPTDTIDDLQEGVIDSIEPLTSKRAQDGYARKDKRKVGWLIGES